MSDDYRNEWPFKDYWSGYHQRWMLKFGGSFIGSGVLIVLLALTALRANGWFEHVYLLGAILACFGVGLLLAVWALKSQFETECKWFYEFGLQRKSDPQLSEAPPRDGRDFIKDVFKDYKQ